MHEQLKPRPSGRGDVTTNKHTNQGLHLVLSRMRQIDLARQLGITRSAVSQWDRVPLERVPDVARVTGLEWHEIRPDHYRRPAA